MKVFHLPVKIVVTALLMAVIASCQQTTVYNESSVSNSTMEPIQFIDELQRKPSDRVVIPYRKFELRNGLTVILHEDHSDPLVHVDVTYHVGSAREEVGKSGFAHFFEHMMFQGSENVDDEEHFKIVASSGGTNNGTTNSDRTNYFQTVPANQLEKILWLEADRMGYFLNAVTQEKFENQRDTVKNERQENYENRPYGLLYERVKEALYPEGHPYSWSTIGHIEDLNRVDVNDLKKFFLRWYGPNNATLTIGGDFDESITKEWIVKYFGSIPKGPNVKPPEKTDVTLSENRYISLEDRVHLPLLHIAFPTVHLFHPDEAPLDVLMFALGRGETSVLYKNMVKNQIAVQATANHGCLELACTFAITALPNPAAGNTLTDIERIARDSLAEFESRGITNDDVERVKTNIISGMIYGLESVAGKVSQLAQYQTYTKQPDYMRADIVRYQNVSPDDVMRVYRKYLKNKPAVIMSVVPQGALKLRTRSDTWTRYERKLPKHEPVTDLSIRRGYDEFDRSIIPPSGKNPEIRLPEIWQAELSNGIRVLGTQNLETPTTSLALRIEAGQREESLDTLGVAALTAAMLNESTQLSTNEELSDRLQKLGASVSFGSGNNSATLNVRSLTENIQTTLAIAAERLLKPAFSTNDFSRVKSQTLQAIAQNKTQAESTAQLVFQKLVLGPENTISHLDIGTEESVTKLTLSDTQGFYANRYSPSLTNLVVVSDLPKEKMLAELSVFGDWEGPVIEPSTVVNAPEIREMKLFLIDKPNAAQSEIRIGGKGPNYDATGDYYRARLANFVLGGAFNSRINLNLREDKGYTYGARLQFVGYKDYGMTVASTGVRTNVTAQSIVELLNEINGYVSGGISEEELVFLKNAIGQRDARRFETPSQKVGFLGQMLVYDLSPDFITQQSDILKRIGDVELNAISRKYLDTNNMIIVVVGDKKTILPGLEKLGYEVIVVDESGERI